MLRSTPNAPVTMVPYENSQFCEEASDFFDRLDHLDERVREIITKQHKAEMDRINRTRKYKPPYARVDWLWVKTPRSVVSLGLKALWYGPRLVAERTGAHSYNVMGEGNNLEAVHADQLKPVHGDVHMGDGDDLFFSATADGPKNKPED